MKFSIILILVQILFIVLYAVLVDYGDMAIPHKMANSSKFTPQPTNNDISVYYPSKFNEFIVFYFYNII